MALVAVSPLRAAVPPELSACAARLGTAPSVSFRLTMTTGGSTTHPLLTISGNKYRLSSPQMEVWYDGKTMWVFDTASREVSISEPTPEELVECNPMALLTDGATAFASQSAGKNAVRLTARSKTSALRSATVAFNPATKFPSRIDATVGSNTPVVIVVDSAVEGKTLPASTFRYDSKSFSAKEIIDLR